MRLALPPETGRRALRLGFRLLPLTLLTIQLLLSFQLLRQTDQLNPHVLPDTYSYRRAANAPTLQHALSHHRTLGYPLLLRYVESGGSGSSGVPRLQAQLALASVVVFFLGLSVYGGSRWLALAAATPLVWARSHAMVPWVESDSLALSLTVAMIGSLLFLAARPRSPWAWAGVTLGVLAAYHTRPSTLFLVVLVPVLAVALRLCRTGAPPRTPWRRDLGRWGLGIAAATLLPFLAFATLRWAMVGHFGLVSFGGANLIGITASFIDSQVVDELPPEQAALARRILARRRQQGWQPMAGSSDPAAYFDQYNKNVWKIARQATRRPALELAADGRTPGEAATRPGERSPAGGRAQWIVQNRLMTELSREIIRLRPYLYLNWVRRAWSHGLEQLLDDGWLAWPLLLLVVSMPFAWLFGQAGGRPPPAVGEAAADRRRGFALLGLLLVATGYFAAYMGLVCMVSYPILRYTIATAIFLPPLVCALLFELWRRILRQLSSGGVPGDGGWA